MDTLSNDLFLRLPSEFSLGAQDYERVLIAKRRNMVELPANTLDIFMLRLTSLIKNLSAKEITISLITLQYAVWIRRPYLPLKLRSVGRVLLFCNSAARQVPLPYEKAATGVVRKKRG